MIIINANNKYITLIPIQIIIYTKIVATERMDFLFDGNSQRCKTKNNIILTTYEYVIRINMHHSYCYTFLLNTK